MLDWISSILLDSFWKDGEKVVRRGQNFKIRFHFEQFISVSKSKIENSCNFQFTFVHVNGHIDL